MKYTIEINEYGFYNIYSPELVMECFMLPRNKVTKKCIDEIEKEGSCFVYFLIDWAEGKKTKRKFYIGETTDLYNRVTDHKSKRKWWSHILLFTNKFKIVDETTVKSLEKIFISQYEKLDTLYDLDNSKKSDVKLISNLDSKVDYILEILDLLSYGAEVDSDETDLTDSQQQQRESLLDSINKMVNKVNHNILITSKKLYSKYYLNTDNGELPLFALWPKKESYEAEIFSSINALNINNNKLYDISNRLRGNRQCALKISNKQDIDLLEEIIKLIGISKQVVNRQKALTFSSIGIQPGTELKLKTDPSIVAVTTANNKLIYGGKEYSMTGLATKFVKLNGKTRITGTEYWTYNGVELAKLRKK